MKKLGLQLSCKLYEVKKLYPEVIELWKRMNSVKCELNKGMQKSK